MAVASPISVRVNPLNTAQRYILWGNGRIDAVGGAVPIVGQANWYNRVDMPVAVALHISNWATGAGYIFTANGSVHDFNGAAAIAGGVFGGVPYQAHEKRYIDWSWDPSGSGQGYALDVYGQLYPFGGATSAPRAGRRWSWPAAKKLAMQWSPTKMAVTLDLYGGLSVDFGATGFSGGAGAYWKGKDYARDLVVTDWSTASSIKGYTLDLYGGIHQFGGAIASFGYPYRAGADVARCLAVISATDPATLWQVWSGGQQYEWTSSTPPTVVAGGGTNESQTVTITGAPTGGTFTLTFSGQTTAAIARNATAATVDAALEALSNITVGNLTVTGGPGPTTPWVVTFGGTQAATDVAQMTATSSLTGGTTPTVTVATTTGGIGPSPAASVTTTTRPSLAWTYADPQNNSQAAWQVYVFTQTFVTGHSMTDPSVWATSALVAQSGTNRTTRGIDSPVDLPNGTYRMYVRAQDTAGQWSAWSDLGWTQAITPPATPTGLTATANQAAYKVALSVSATTGGSANLIRFQCSDDAGVTWQSVRGADAVPLIATTTATDWDPPLGVTRVYRAIAYATNPAVASVASSTASATITALAYVVTAVDDPSLGGKLRVQEPVSWTRPVVAGVFQGLGGSSAGSARVASDFPTVVKDGRPKAKRAQVEVFTEDAANWAVVAGLAESGSTLVYRDPFGSVRYCEMVGDWSAELFPGAGTRHLHTTTVPLVEVSPPQLGL